MQGIARMVLETGVHPAALKDSVTSRHLLHYLVFTNTFSPWWMYDSWTSSPRRRQSSLNDGTYDTGSYHTCRWPWTKQEVNNDYSV